MTTDLNIIYLYIMIHREEERSNYLGTLFFAVLCFLLFLSFSTISRDSSPSSPSHLRSEITLSSSRAVVSASIQLPELQSSSQSLRYATHLTLFRETFRLFAAERANTQSLSLLEKKELWIKPLLCPRSISLRLPPPGKEEPAILG